MGRNERVRFETQREWLRAVDGRAVAVHAVAALVTVTALGAGWLAVRRAGYEGSDLTREPQVTLDGPLWTGAVSNAGGVVWTIAATVSAVAAASARRREERMMFASVALLSAVLMIDDLFLVHDALREVGVPEKLFVGGYLVAVVALAIRFWDVIGPSGLLGIVVTLAFLGISAGLDMRFNAVDQMVEDGAKMLGIVSWAVTWTLRFSPWRA